MTSSYELHGAKTGNCVRVAIGFEETGIDYLVNIVDLMQGQHFTRSHRALNPAAQVPVLVETRAGGERFVLTQSNAILLYLDQLCPGVLVPESASERAKVIERFMFFVTDVTAPGHLSFHLRRPDTIYGSRYLENLALKGIELTESFLDDSEFVGGDRFSIADIAAFTIIWTMANNIDWSALPKLMRWYQMMVHRPAVMNGMKAFG
jgi:GSH-dependent disulfide-bond oxidoreductase